MGPICVACSSELPTVSDAANPVIVSTTSLYRDLGANTLVHR